MTFRLSILLIQKYTQSSSVSEDEAIADLSYFDA